MSLKHPRATYKEYGLPNLWLLLFHVTLINTKRPAWFGAFFCIRTLLFWTQQEALKSWPGEPQVSQLNFHLDLETRCSSASPALYANLTGPFRAHRRDQASRKTWHRRQHYHLACKTQRGGLSCMMWNICTQFPLCRGTLMSCNIKQHVEHRLFKKK